MTPRHPRQDPQIVQERLSAASRTRERKAGRRQCAVLSGGWGYAAQIAEWDRIEPDWRLLRRMTLDGRAALRVKDRNLAPAWGRLIVQTVNNDHDTRPLLTNQRLGGYPIRSGRHDHHASDRS